MNEQIVDLAGALEKILFKSEENGYFVGGLRVSNARDLITITGHLPDAQLGEHLFLRGIWTFHAKFGRQFEVKECTKTLPSDVIGIKKYLGSGLIKGIGPKFAERLVDRFGASTLEIIDKQPHRLAEVSGVGPARAEAIVAAWQTQKEISRVMVFLQAKEVSTAFAAKIYKAYGNNAIEVITQNPYRLTEDIWGVGFKTADGLALKLGIEKISPYRIKAGIIHAITGAVEAGHLYALLEKVKSVTAEVLELTDEEAPMLIKLSLHELYTARKIVLLTHDDRHFLSLPQYYWVEKGIASRLLTLKDYALLQKFDFNAVYDRLRHHDDKGVHLNEDQQRGILMALQQKVSIITGGPGTGKTTLVKKLLEILESYKVKVRLAAPTGRAAKRMFEGTGRSAETLHRLLEFTPTTMNFARNEQNAVDAEFVIIDEASMIDVFLMHSLLKAMPAHAHLLLLGDVDQLPSVGAGDVLNDLIASEKVSVTRLTHIFRQAQGSLIIINAHRINEGEFPTNFHEGSKRDFIFIKQDEPEQVFPLLRELYTTTLAKHGIASHDAVVLVPMNRGVVGTQRLNQELQIIINPRQDETQHVGRFGTIYKIGDRVMQIRNNYDKFVFNGDMGEILRIDKTDQEMIVKFGERELLYDFAELDELVLSYAVSIHKSQGSEFPAVIIPIFMQHFMLLQRNLLYTAVTRAKRLCILIGQPKAIGMAVRNKKAAERNTFLKEFLTTNLTAR